MQVVLPFCFVNTCNWDWILLFFCELFIVLLLDASSFDNAFSKQSEQMQKELNLSSSFPERVIRKSDGLKASLKSQITVTNLEVFANISTNSYNPAFLCIFVDWKAMD